MTDAQTSTTALPITIRGLTKRYGSVYALNGVDLDVRSGEFLTLLGPSGSGKTTLLMAIAGFNRPDSGSVRFGDEEVILKPPHKRDVGMVFQSYALFPHMTVAENIGFPLKLRSVSAADRAKRVDEALETVQLSGFGGRNIDQLSGGQRQRVALARAFVFGPRILLMDEPLSALDKKLRERMQIELKHLHRKLGVTTVYVTHDQREALTMSDRIAVINDGEIAQLGSPEEIYNRPANAFVADFIGESTMLPLTREQSGALSYRGKVFGDAGSQPGDDWTLVIRPERLFFANAGDETNDKTIILHGALRETVFQGESEMALVEVEGGVELAVRFGTGATQNAFLGNSVGDQVSIGLARKDAIIIPGRQAI